MAGKGITPQIARKIRLEKGLTETKLATIRIKKGLSQRALAELSGVPARLIQSYEIKETRIEGAKLNTLCSLCAALGCKIEDILDDQKLIKKYKAIK